MTSSCGIPDSAPGSPGRTGPHAVGWGLPRGPHEGARGVPACSFPVREPASSLGSLRTTPGGPGYPQSSSVLPPGFFPREPQELREFRAVEGERAGTQVLCVDRWAPCPGARPGAMSGMSQLPAASLPLPGTVESPRLTVVPWGCFVSLFISASCAGIGSRAGGARLAPRPR